MARSSAHKKRTTSKSTRSIKGKEQASFTPAMYSTLHDKDADVDTQNGNVGEAAPQPNNDGTIAPQQPKRKGKKVSAAMQGQVSTTLFESQ